MRMKKVILALVVILAVGQSSMTVMAHGHGGYRSYRNYNYQNNVAAPTVTYALCNVADCNVMGLHDHDGTYYCGHYMGDGHDYHQLCSVQGCTMTGVHDHDGVACMPHSAGDGHSYHHTSGYGRGRHH